MKVSTAAKSEYDKKYYAAHRDEIKAKVRAWARANPDKVRARSLRRRGTPKSLLIGARRRAKAQGVPFSICAEDIVIPQTCPVLGISLRSSQGGVSPNSPSIDRLRPERGYVPGNIAVISHRANTIKQNATAIEIRAVADWLDKQVK